MSDSSLRCYIELATAASISDRWRLAGLEPAAKLAQERLLDYFPPDCFRQEYGAQRPPQNRLRIMGAPDRPAAQAVPSGVADAGDDAHHDLHR